MTRALELGRAIKVAADYKRPLTVDAVVAPRRRIRRFTSLLVLSYQSQRGTFGSVRARTTIVRKLTEADQLVADRRVVTPASRHIVYGRGSKPAQDVRPLVALRTRRRTAR
jgi:hypothetical protein